MSSQKNSHQLPPISSQGLVRLELEADQISLEVADGYYALNPKLYQDSHNTVQKMFKSDFQQHMNFLLTSMTSAAIKVFKDYAHWLKGVMDNRNLSVQHTVEVLYLMKHFITARLNDDDQIIAVTIIDSGVDILTGKRLKQNPVNHENSNTPLLSADYTRSLVHAHTLSAERIAMALMEQKLSLIDLEVHVVQPSMYKIGDLWEQNKITVAQEHTATAISQNVLALSFAKAEFNDPVEKKVLCSCVEGNHHGLGLRMVSDAYEISGWDVSFLGTNTPNSVIMAQVDTDKPDVLALSVSMPHQIIDLQKLLTCLRADMAGSMPVIVIGGLTLNNYQQLAYRLKPDAWYQNAKAVWEYLN